MNVSTLSIPLIASLLLLLPLNFSYAEQAVYGWQLMTEQERNEHRAKMRSFKTEQEREAYRIEHHKQMQERARQQGVVLPDPPLQRGKGMQGRGTGPGQGKGGGGRYSQ